MDTKQGDNAGEESSSAASLSAEEFESWTLVDRSPKAGHLKMKPGEPEKDPIDEEEAEDEDDEEASDEEDEENGSSEGEVEEDDDDKEDKSGKPSGVEPVKNKPKQTKRELGDVTEARDEDRDDARASSKKKHAGSNISLHSHDEFSSDGISVISESDGSENARLHLNKQFNLDQLQQSSVQLTPPLSPETDDERTEERSKRNRQLKRKISQDDVDNALVPDDAIVPWRHVNRTSFVIFSIVLTGIAAILVGNSRMYENRATINTFDHEKRLSELELENTILKNEMNKLKHLYTRSELDEQVQQAEFEWMQSMDQEMQDQSPTEPEPQPEPEPSTSAQPESEPPLMRRVPPQDDNVRHRVVWSGDDGQPMLIADKDYVLPEFCYNKNAVQDELFSEYSAKYCDSKQRKIDAKLKKAEYYAGKHNKHKHPRDYKQYIHPTPEEVAEHQKQATAPPPKVPSLSPFDFDYLSAFETIKEEGSVILQSLTAILDLDPEPELLPPVPSAGYLADDEASSSTSASSVGSAPSQSTEQPSTSSAPINWGDYPPWVQEKYENQPEMYRKLQNKAPLLWEWERKKNQFLDEVGLSTLEEIDRKTEDELRQRREQYEKERGGRRQSGERGGEEQQQSYKYEERKAKEGKFDERKEYRPRNGDDRSHERKDYRKEHHKEWKDKEWRNGDKSREFQEKQRRDDQRQPDFERPSTSREGSGQKQQYKVDGSGHDSGESREVSSGDRDPRYKDKHDYRKNGEHGKYRKDSDEWKDHKKNGDRYPKRRDSDERGGSGEGSHPKLHHQDEHKKPYKSSKEEYHHDRKYDEKKPYHDRSGEDDDDDDDDYDDDDDHYKRRHHDKHHRNGDDYRKHEKKEWHDKRHKHKKGDHWNKHEDKKWHDRDREHHHQSKESKERRRR